MLENENELAKSKLYDNSMLEGLQKSVSLIKRQRPERIYINSNERSQNGHRFWTKGKHRSKRSNCFIENRVSVCVVKVMLQMRCSEASEHSTQGCLGMFSARSLTEWLLYHWSTSLTLRNWKDNEKRKEMWQEKVMRMQAGVREVLHYLLEKAVRISWQSRLLASVRGQALHTVMNWKTRSSWKEY